MRALLLFLALASFFGAPRYEVLVYGATPAGVCAAVAAAREGASVALVSPYDYVGGMVSGGLSLSDGNQCVRQLMGGLFVEVHERICKHYADAGVKLNYKIDLSKNDKWTYEPHVAEKVFHELIEEAGVDVYLEHRLAAVTKKAARIKTIETSKGIFHAGQFIDATYEGDLMAAAGVSYAVGRESKQQYGESLAGHQFPKKPVKVGALDEAGEPLPLLTGESPGEDKGDEKIMTYSFRVVISTDPSNRLPMPEPANYDPARFELARRYIKANPKAAGRMVSVDGYPLPNRKVDLNNGIGRQISAGLVGASWAWPEATYEEREKIWEAHKQYTLELLWFLKTDPVVPETVRRKFAAYGLAGDEFQKYGGWPPALYVREGRRMIGEHVLTQHDVRTDARKKDSIGISSFPIDSHDCQRVPTADGKGWINEGTIFPDRINGNRHGHPYQVPYRSLTPKRVECINLLVPVCLSSSHVALSSIRVEPTWMMLGHSAGVAAAMAHETKAAVQELPYDQLKRRLLDQEQVIDFPPGYEAGSAVLRLASPRDVKDLVTPVMTDESPAAGKRVRQVAQEYEGTAVHHALYLPVDWKPGGKYPVIVEYTGNKFPPGKGSGEVKDANLGYGMSGGRGWIWVSMPYVEKGRKENAVTWWGDKQATVDYCKVNLPRICKQFGGDPDKVFICGFSRGAIGVSYIGLADDEIASLWKGMFTHDHFDGHKKWGYPESDRASALKRLARLKGRPVLVCGGSNDYLEGHLDLARFTFLDVPVGKIFKIPEGKVIHPHTDLWMHRESAYRQQARAWLQKELLSAPTPQKRQNKPDELDAVSPEYRLVWADEFEAAGKPDPKN